jgi:hypothetical protein
MLDQRKLGRTLNRIGQLLVAGDYEGLARLTNSQRLTADELRQAVLDYGRRLVPPPQDTWSTRSTVEIEDTVPEAWSVYVDLWTAEEGRSDLTLELTIRDSAADTYTVEIDNLHVL